MLSSLPYTFGFEKVDLSFHPTKGEAALSKKSLALRTPFPVTLGWPVKNVMRLLPTFICASLLSSCLSTILGSKENRSRDYTFPEPGRDWESLDPAEADSAYRNPIDRAILNVTSVCGNARYQSLEQLTAVVLKQLPETVTQPSEIRQIGGFPGMVTAAEGQVDGQPLKVRLAVIRSEKCLYDIILAGQSFDPSSLKAFESALSGFRERP